MIVEQPDLFGDQRVSNQRPGGLLAHSRSTDPQSSKDAAASVNGNRQMRVILEVLLVREHFGEPSHVTADIMREAASYSLPRRNSAGQTFPALSSVERNAWSSRLSAMEAKGLLEAAGEVPGRYGRPVRAFRLSEAGRAAAEGLRGVA